MILKRLIFIIPMVFAIVGLVLSSLCLFAGHEEGFMEDFAVARLNTSMLGQNMIDITSDENQNEDEEEAEDKDEDDDDDDGGFFDSLKDDVKDKAKDIFEDVKGSVEDKVNDITGSIADELAEALGISEWYSLHIMAACEGLYKPDATADNAGFNVTNCTSSRPTHRLNLTGVLDHELGIGPFELNLADIGWPEEVQENIDLINDLILALFIFYVLGMGFSGLSLISCVLAFLKPMSNLINMANLVFASLAALVLLVGASIATAAGTKGVNAINKVANKVGVEAQRGTNFIIINWVAAGLMLLATIFWVWRLHAVRKERKYGSPKGKPTY